MSSKKLLYFKKFITLHIPTDFNSTVTDGIKRITNDIFNRRERVFVITDAQQLFKIDNLTRVGFVNWIDNDFNIKFNRMNLNCLETNCHKEYEINSETRDKLVFPYIKFVAFSIDYIFIKEDKETVTILIDEEETVFNIQSLRNIGVHYDFQL